MAVNSSRKSHLRPQGCCEKKVLSPSSSCHSPKKRRSTTPAEQPLVDAEHGVEIDHERVVTWIWPLSANGRGSIGGYKSMVWFFNHVPDQFLPRMFDVARWRGRVPFPYFHGLRRRLEVVAVLPMVVTPFLIAFSSSSHPLHNERTFYCMFNDKTYSFSLIDHV